MPLNPLGTMHLNSNLNMTQSKASPEIIARTQEEVISKEELMEVKRRRAETQKGITHYPKPYFMTTQPR